MADVFLMGTAGSYNDPNRSMWREPIKAALTGIGVSYFDPVVPTWNEEAAKREAEALATAKILILAVTADTSGVGSLAESGWLVASAMMRDQWVAIWIDTSYEGQRLTQGTQAIRRDMLKQKGPDSIEDASRRARKLVNSHARKLIEQYPKLHLYVARDLNDLKMWTVNTAKQVGTRKKFLGIF